MYSRVLVPLDGSPLSQQVLPYVRLVAKALQLPVELMSAFSPVPEELADPQHGLYIDQLATTFREQAHKDLHPIEVSLQDSGFAVSTTVREGDAASRIVDEAEKQPDTLIAMSTHGRSGISRWVMGSVTDKVLHATTSPMMIIRCRPEESVAPDVKLSSMIVPLDGSSHAQSILPHVATMAKGLGSKILLTRVTTSTDSSLDPAAYLSQVAERLRREGITALEEQLLQGDVSDTIVNLTHQIADNMVAVTTHGHSGVKHWLGSITHRIVNHAGGPVLVCRCD